MTDEQVMDFVNGCGKEPILGCIEEADFARLPVVRALYRPAKVRYIRRKDREATKTCPGKESAGERSIENVKARYRLDGLIIRWSELQLICVT